MESKVRLTPSIAIMVILTFSAVVVVAVLSEVEVARRIDPRWVSATALWILVVLCFWGVLGVLEAASLAKQLIGELQRLTTQVFYLRRNLEKQK